MADTSTTTPKGLQNTPRSIGRGSRPATPRSAYVQLYMHQNERERLIKERERIRTRAKHIKKRLTVLNRDMGQLLKIATKGMKRGNPGNPAGNKGFVLNY